MKRFCLLLSAIILSLSLNAQSFIKGDLNDDGDITIADVTMLVDIILGKIPSESYNANGIVIDGYSCVNLGLSSGTLWAAMNVGASSPEDYGNFFAWGETEGSSDGKESFSWPSYIWSGQTFDKLTKYCNNKNYGIVDNILELELTDDAAYQSWSHQWRIPTNEQLSELMDECVWTWTVYKNINGYEVKGPNGNSIFIPAGGVYDVSGYRNEGSIVSIWSRSLVPTSCSNAYVIVGNANESPVIPDDAPRYYGRNIRPVAYIK